MLSMTRLLALLPLTLVACTDTGKGGGGQDTADTGTPTPSVDEDGDGYSVEEDCDDADEAVHPGADEVCNDKDDDCDGTVDVDAIDATAWYADADADGYGDADAETVACAAPTDHVADATDCDDSASQTHPGADELCDEADNDCDTEVDEEPVDGVTRYTDADGDGYGVDAFATCDPDAGAEIDGDCDDADEDINPGEFQQCSPNDEDCDPSTTSAGLVTFVAPDGTPTDVSSAWAAGTSGSPVGLSLEDDGAYNICEGTWTVALDISADVQLHGQGGSDVVVLSGGGVDTVVSVVDQTVDVVVTGLTITEGYGTWVVDFPNAAGGDAGGGLVCAGGSTMALDDVVVTENDGYRGGGLAVTDGCRVDVADSVFQANTGSYGAAAVIDDGVLTFTDSEVADHTTPVNAAIFAGWSQYDADDGITAVVEFHDTLVHGNAADFGGGLAMYGFSEALCTASEGTSAGFVDNTSTRAPSSGAGGVYIDDDFDDADAILLESQGCDWGTEAGGDDNSTDVFLDYSNTTYDFGDDADFTCTLIDCE